MSAQKASASWAKINSRKAKFFNIIVPLQSLKQILTNFGQPVIYEFFSNSQFLNCISYRVGDDGFVRSKFNIDILQYLNIIFCTVDVVLRS